MSTQAWSRMLLFLGSASPRELSLAIYLTPSRTPRRSAECRQVGADIYRAPASTPRKTALDAATPWRSCCSMPWAWRSSISRSGCKSSLPLNPQALANVTPDSAFDTAVSFVTNTNWRGYLGESTMSYFTQMVALAVQNFLSAPTGISLRLRDPRFCASLAQGIGYFWVDLTRQYFVHSAAAILTPGRHFHGQGVIQNLTPIKSSTLES